MDAFVFLLVAVVVLMMLVSRIYGGKDKAGEEAPEPEDRRADRLALVLDPDVMEGLTTIARKTQSSEVDLANRLLREAIQRAEARSR